MILLCKYVLATPLAGLSHIRTNSEFIVVLVPNFKTTDNGFQASCLFGIVTDTLTVQFYRRRGC